MDPIVVTFITSGAATGVVALSTALLFKRYLSGYMEEKGKNLATREDVAAITREVECIRHDYSVLLEEMKARHQLRLGALDTRLQVHQEAFTNWRKLFMSSRENFEAASQEYRDWWNLNCLYLEPQARGAYLDVVNQELRRRARLSAGGLTASAELSDPHFEEMFSFPNLLFKVIQLPTLSEVEQSALQSDTHGQARE
jgi:hypothetical protein